MNKFKDIFDKINSLIAYKFLKMYTWGIKN